MIREADLEKYLREYNQEDYYETFQRIQSAAKDIWKEPRLGWYTDHGPKHSERIIFHLNRLCAGLLSIPGTDASHYGLTVEEVFLLLAAAWLHDIGMQDLSDLSAPSVEGFNANDWEEVRKRHPLRAYEMIMDPTTGDKDKSKFWIGIKPDSIIRAPLALICKGHGSGYFSETIKQFRGRTFDFGGKGKKIRGDLLTALLLMADELDLHYSRALFKENYPLSGVSKLHHFRHHYIENVEVIPALDGIHDTHRTINIIFHFPQGKAEDKLWTNHLQKWVEAKIKKEANQTAAILHAGFKGYFYWSNPIVNCKIEPAFENEKIKMDKSVQYCLAAEFQKTIDWKDITLKLSSRFKEKKGGVVCINAGKEQGIDRFIDFIQVIFGTSAKGNHHDVPLAILEFSSLKKYQTIDDVFEEIAGQLESILNKQKSDSLIRHLQSHGDLTLVILKHLDEAGKDLIGSIAEKIINVCRQNAGNLFIIITSTRNLEIFGDLSAYNLPEKFTETDIYEYLLETCECEETARYKLSQYVDFLKMHGTLSPAKSLEIIGILNKKDKRGNIPLGMNDGVI